MPRGQVAPSIVDPDFAEPDELVVAIHLARELAFRTADSLCETINRQSAKSKMYNYPNSYHAERSAR